MTDILHTIFPMLFLGLFFHFNSNLTEICSYSPNKSMSSLIVSGNELALAITWTICALVHWRAYVPPNVGDFMQCHSNLILNLEPPSRDPTFLCIIQRSMLRHDTICLLYNTPSLESMQIFRSWPKSLGGIINGCIIFIIFSQYYLFTKCTHFSSVLSGSVVMNQNYNIINSNRPMCPIWEQYDMFTMR